ncbi:MAG: murein DD-endopeptidase MepM/ murein hydrolase activator NlpD [Saprospiraceae bacterium]|jgi:murein DD-endopeptidase MepM/ murein hydrolase activator NlpD
MHYFLLIKKVSFTFALLLSASYIFAQERDSLMMETDSTDVFFEKIRLDNSVAYRNESTGEIIDQTEYTLLCEADIPADGSGHEGHDHYDYWQCDKINPYKDVVLTTPFKLEFDQSTFTHPIDGKIVVTSRFGRRRRGPHRGFDIDLVTGDFVRSVLPGKIRFVGYSRGHGKTVVVRHANDVETVYAHLSAYTVKINDVIKEGQIIGFGGNTGNSRGSHLHLEVRYKGVCIHPEYVFNFDGSQTINGSELWVTNGWKSPRMHSSYRKSKIEPLGTETVAIDWQKNEPKFHQIKRGDTLSQLARSYSLRISEICSLNAISSRSILKIGQIIQIR